MTREPDQQAQDIIREQEIASGLRGNWESVWEQIAQRILTQYTQQFKGQNRSASMTGQQRTEEMVDATGALALTRFAAAMESMLTPRHSTWHTLIPDDPALMQNRMVRFWFEDVTRLLFRYRYAPTANYASQKHEDYLMLGAFGTGTIFTDALQLRGQQGLRYRAVHLGQNYFMENHQGIIDQNYRRFDLTARQAVQQFGADNLPEKIAKDGADPKRGHEVYWFIHKVAPRKPEAYDPERRDVKGMPWESIYVSVTGQQTVKESGYYTFPYSISRYVTTPGEVYGRSPAMFALPSIKGLNEIKKTLLKQGHRITDPVLLMHDDGVLDSFSLRPGALNPGGVNADGKLLVQPLPTGNIAVGKDQALEEKQTINDFFLVTLFQILVDTPQMTATEVVERAREKGALLSPTMGRQQSESLGPQIERELDVLQQQRLLPPMPQRLLDAQGKYTIQYDSPLTRMARSEEVAGLMRTIDYFKEVISVTQDPSPLDHYDWDTIVPEVSDIQAIPVRWRKSMQEIQAVRQDRAKQAQQQQMVDAAPAASNVLKTLMPKPPAQPAGVA